jgi:hypothetical protein
MQVSNIIIITILVLIVIFFISRVFFQTDIIYDMMCNARETYDAGINEIDNQDLKDSTTSNFMLSVWFYVNNWSTDINQEKNILFVSNSSENDSTFTEIVNNFSGISNSRCDTSTGSSYKNLNICLGKYENNLFIDIETAATTSCNGSTFTRYIIKNIPIQKWNCLTLSVDTKTFDVYLDGKLRNSFILPGIYHNGLNDPNRNRTIYIGNINSSSAPGFEGFITRIRYQPNAINPQEAYNIYKEGISASLAKSLFNKYGLKVSFLEYNTEKHSFSI